MSKCPNSDPNFDKVMANFFDITSKSYPSNRKMVFYGICIWVRFALYYYIYKHRDEKYIPYVIGALAVGSIMNLKNSVDNPGRQWWSKRFDLMISILLLISCVGAIMKKLPTVYIPYLLYLSLISGIIQSLTVTFC